MPSGRKSLREEIGVLNRYAELAPKYFKFISQMLDEESAKEDRKWAAERLDKAFPKMIPQDLDITSNGNSLTIQWLQSPTPQEAGQQPSTIQQSDGLSSSSTDEQEKQ